MDWSATGYILSVRSHGETSAIINIFTKDRGRCAGLVRGGRSRRMRPILQPGNKIGVVWRARLSEHLGNFTIEPLDGLASALMQDRLSLAGLNAISSLILETLPEREPHGRLYEVYKILLQNLADIDIWPALYIRFEIALLQALGYGLDFSECAATGVSENLTHISPRSGRAVSEIAAKPYIDKLLEIPRFLMSEQGFKPGDLEKGFALCEYFLRTRVFHTTNRDIPEPRKELVSVLAAKGLLEL